MIYPITENYADYNIDIYERIHVGKQANKNLVQKVDNKKRTAR